MRIYRIFVIGLLPLRHKEAYVVSKLAVAERTRTRQDRLGLLFQGVQRFRVSEQSP